MRWDQIVVCYSLSPAWIAIRAAAFPVRHFHQKGPGGGCSASMIAATTNKKKVVVVGGGWAGFSAADALSKLDGVDVLVLDASKRGPGGLASGWSSPRLGMPVEGGIHGFWREYRNTFSIMESLGLELDEVLTPYTPSILVSEAGRVALAPVLGKEDDERSNSRKADRMKGIPSGLSLDLADTLPSPLDIALLSKFEMSSLSVTDRLSAIGLLGAWADFGQEDVASWSRYDGISADQLFQDVAGVTPRLYQQLVLPLLHVLPMTPGYDCSAAAALSCFHVFALQSKGAFDVRWCRGTISEKIFDPWSRQLRARNVTIQGSSRVTALRENTTNRILTVTINNQTEVQCDAIVLAIGTTAAKALVQSCPPLASIPLTAKWDDTTLRGVTCVAVRLFLYPQSAWVKDIRVAMSDSPVAVCGPRVGGISELTETGFCIYDLQRLQDYFGDMFQEGKCFTIEVDFFRADALSDMSDERVADVTIRAVSAALNIHAPQKGEEAKNATLSDISVVRARNAVTHFCVGSASASPPSTKLRRGIYMCGDWIERTGHASWSTEKAVVTGRRAAMSLAQDFVLTSSNNFAPIIPAAADTPQLSSLRKISATLRQALPFLTESIPPAPWIALSRRVRS